MPSETDGEQRRVTLMFADISGSTELVEHLDPEEAANLLDPMIAAMTETAERYAGSVSPRGDGILAMFGVAGAIEDNAVRACLAALEILQHLGNAKPRVRIGIHHGEVALLSGRRGPSRENFFGPAIHIAARLEQTAEPGSASLSSRGLRIGARFRPGRTAAAGAGERSSANRFAASGCSACGPPAAGAPVWDAA